MLFISRTLSTRSNAKRIFARELNKRNLWLSKEWPRNAKTIPSPRKLEALYKNPSASPY